MVHLAIQRLSMELTIAQRRVGTDETSPESTPLKAGALTADLVAGGLRTIRYQGREVLRAIAYVVRDKDWGTFHPVISDFACHQDGHQFTVTYRARCINSELGQELEYETRITGNAKGLITFEVTAEPRTPFLTARCGFAVLHPLEGVVGQPAIIEHVDGSHEQAAFPDLIAPMQPFKEIRAIEHLVAPGITARCLMTGDVFEMEDQRNWSDASYKTYVRPLALPWPYVMESGVRNQQAVELLITNSSAGAAETVDAKPDAPIQLEIGEPDGTFPQIGVAIHPDEIATVLAHPDVLKRLRPQLLLFHFDPTAGHGREHLAGFGEIAQIAEASQCALELVVPAQRNVKDELREIAAMASGAKLKLSALLVSPAVDRQSTLPGRPWPSCPPLEEIYQAAREAFPGAAIGGGMLTYFTELNRKRPPVELLDFVSHCTCPIVHAADDLSVMQTLEAMPSITRSARAIMGKDKPYWIGPSTIGMRQNPYGSRVMNNPENRRITMTDHDPRQTSLFAAAWMIGYTASTAEGHLQVLTVGAMTGPLGLASTNSVGEITYHPAFYAAQGLAAMGGRLRYRCRSSWPDAIAAVAGTDREGNRVAWIANLTGQNQVVMLAGGMVLSRIDVLDEENFAQPRGVSADAVASIELRPYAVACLWLRSG
jgi:D-apionolactonase